MGNRWIAGFAAACLACLESGFGATPEPSEEAQTAARISLDEVVKVYARQDEIPGRGRGDPRWFNEIRLLEKAGSLGAWRDRAAALLRDAGKSELQVLATLRIFDRAREHWPKEDEEVQKEPK